MIWIGVGGVVGWLVGRLLVLVLVMLVSASLSLPVLLAAVVVEVGLSTLVRRRYPRWSSSVVLLMLLWFVVGDADAFGVVVCVVVDVGADVVVVLGVA